jgi:hypothetical protein
MMQVANASEPSGQLHNSAVDVKQRLSGALFELNLKLASCKSGALVQVRTRTCQSLGVFVCHQLKTLARIRTLLNPICIAMLRRYGCQMFWRTAAWF